MTYDNLFNSPYAWADSNDPSSPVGVKHDVMIGLHVGYLDSADYDPDWSIFDELTDLPLSPNAGRWYKRFNTNNSEMREYTYDGSDWHYTATFAGGGIGVEYIKFNTSPTVPSPVEGDVFWNPTYKTLNIQTSDDTTIQVGQEMVVRVYNDNGTTVYNGQAVYRTGTHEGHPSVGLANANNLATSRIIGGVATHDIPPGEYGFITNFGLVNDVDTSGLVEGAAIFLSDTVDGALTTTSPVHPSRRILLGRCEVSDVSVGVLRIKVINLDTVSFYNGTFRESFDFKASSNGTIITGTLERSDQLGDLTALFSDGSTVVDVYPTAQTIALTAGTDAVPQENFIFIPFSTKVLTVNTTGWVSEQHIKIAYMYVPSATKVMNDGVYVNQNWNDHQADVLTGQGHHSHLGERIRRMGSEYFSGITPNGADSYFTLGSGTGYFISNSGIIYQMHKQNIPAYDMSTGADVHVVNDSVTPFLSVTNLNSITAMSDGASLSNNKYFNLVFWMVANKGGEYSPLMINLPNGQYTNVDLAIIDSDKTANYDIPREFNKESSTAFYVCRATFKYGATWTLENVESLLGKDPLSAGGGSSSASLQTEFNDSTFRLFNNVDSSKEVAFDLSGLSTLTTRALTIQDKDLTIAGLDDIADADALVVHLAGTETITGAKTFNDNVIVDIDYTKEFSYNNWSLKKPVLEMSNNNILVDMQASIESGETGTFRNAGGWSYTTEVTIPFFDDTVPFSKVLLTTGGTETWESDFIPVEAGETLYGEMWVMRETGEATTGIVYYGVERYDKDQKAIASNDGMTYFVASAYLPPSDSVWYKKSATTTLPLTHTPYLGSDGGAVRYVRVRILINYNGDVTPTHWGGVRLRREKLVRDDGDISIGGGLQSPDEDLSFTFGRALLASPTTDFMHLSHRDMIQTYNYSLRQSATGGTTLNSIGTGYIRETNNTILSWDANSVDLASGIDLNVAGDITGTGKLYLANIGDVRKTSLSAYLSSGQFVSNHVASVTDGANTKDSVRKFARSSANAYTKYQEDWYDGSSYHTVYADTTGFVFKSGLDITGDTLITGWVMAGGSGTSGLRLKYDDDYYWDNYRDSAGDFVWEVHQNTTNVEMMKLTTSGILSVEGGLGVEGNATITGFMNIGESSIQAAWQTSFDALEFSLHNAIMSNKTSDGLYMISNMHYLAAGWEQSLASQESVVMTLASGNMTLRHAPAGSDTLTERFTYDGSAGDLTITGDISVANGDFSAGIDVTGTAYFGGGTSFWIKLSSSRLPRLISNAIEPVTTDVYDLGTPTKAWLDIFTKNAVTVTSARITKDLIYDLESPLDVVLALKGQSYIWMGDETKKRMIGFIADDVDTIIPEAVVRRDDGSIFGMKNDYILPYVVESIKILDAHDKTMNDKVYNLEQELYIMKQQIKELLK